MADTIEKTKIKYFMSNDVVFKTFFRKNTNVLKKVISMSLRIKECEIKNITFLNTELLKDIPEDKLGIVDLLVEINNNKKINIEIQNVEKHNFPERSEFYLSRLYIEDLEKGSDYKEVKEVCGIFFLNYDDKNYPNFFSVIQNYDTINMKCTRNLKTIVVYNLNKIDEIDKYDFTEEEKNMLKFIKCKNEEELINMAGESMTLNQAIEQLRRINADKKLKQLLFYAEIQRLDENTRKRYEKELEDNIKQLETNKKNLENNIESLEINIESLENNVQSLENNVQSLENNVQSLENNVQSLENDNRQLENELNVEKFKFKSLINTLYQNNSIDEISKMTNLEVDYIKDILNM